MAVTGEGARTVMPALEPLAEAPVDPVVDALPKADLHVHQEWSPRLDRVLARREGRLSFDWRGHARRLLVDTPAGMSRLSGMGTPDAALPLGGIPDGDPETIIAVVTDALVEGGADGAMMVEMRFGPGGGGLARPDFMALFREAERRARGRYPQLRAEAIGYLGLVADAARLSDAERRLEACLRAGRDGLAGVDFRVDPYDTEADPALWAIVYRWAERAVNAGLGVTVHAGEFSTANLAAALRVPGLRRLGHAVYAAEVPRLLEQLARSGVTVECCLSCNVILGAAPSYEAHPIRRFMDQGIPVTLNTDNPVRIWTTIGREYAIASAFGFTSVELLEVTRNAVRALFTTTERRTALLDELRAWEDVA